MCKAKSAESVLTMHVQADAELAASSRSPRTRAKIEFRLLGYWTRGTYVELLPSTAKAASDAIGR